MRKGGYAKFVLPSDLAAGKHGEDPIPPCKTIVLKVALLEVE
jgi:FKBP-type peptidyl-prolyl cis-trans isomerase